MPSFAPDVIIAFNEMNTQESPNDFLVAGLEDASQTVSLVEKGRGGMARVKQILAEQFQARTAVALFRITAVDDRENTVSYRTKIIQVIFTGPKTPVMKRAKVGSYHADFKKPFSANLHIQTDDVDDLEEAALDRSLRLSGGAHAPNRYDFTNSSGPGSSGEARSYAQPAVAAAAEAAEEEAAPANEVEPEEEAPVEEETPVEEEEETYASLDQVMAHHLEAFASANVEAVSDDYDESSTLVLVDAASASSTSYVGVEAIKGAFSNLLEQLGGQDANVLSQENMGQVCKLEWDCSASGFAYCSDTFVVAKGKVILQTVVIVRE